MSKYKILWKNYFRWDCWIVIYHWCYYFIFSSNHLYINIFWNIQKNIGCCYKNISFYIASTPILFIILNGWNSCENLSQLLFCRFYITTCQWMFNMKKVYIISMIYCFLVFLYPDILFLLLICVVKIGRFHRIYNVLT